MRVAFVLRSAEVQPLFRDLCGALGTNFLGSAVNSLPPFFYLLPACLAQSKQPGGPALQILTQNGCVCIIHPAALV